MKKFVITVTYRKYFTEEAKWVDPDHSEVWKEEETNDFNNKKEVKMKVE